MSVGNATQPFTRLLEAVCVLAAQLPQPVFVQFGVAQAFACLGCTGVAFMEMGAFAKRVSEAELLILHAGAGSVIHAVRAGKAPVVVPRRARLGEHVDDHQLEFAHELEKTGKVLVAYDAATLAQAAAVALLRQRLRNIAGAGGPPLMGMVRHALTRAMIGGAVMKHPVRNGLLLVFATLLMAAFLQAGSYLSGSAQAPVRAEVILVLDGDNGDRIAMASRLYHQGYAPHIMLTRLENGSELTRSDYLSRRVQFLLDENVPDSAVILGEGASNTWEEAVNTLALLKQRGWKRVIIVSDPPHMRRLHFVWNKVFAGSDKEFVLVHSAPEWWNPARWWAYEQSRRFVVMEYIKLAYYSVKH